MRGGLYSNQPVMVYKREYVDIHIPPDRFSEMNAAAHAELDAKFEQHKAILGDSEKVVYAAMDVEGEALDAVSGLLPPRPPTFSRCWNSSDQTGRLAK
jgi:hypothetical protein